MGGPSLGRDGRYLPIGSRPPGVGFWLGSAGYLSEILIYLFVCMLSADVQAGPARDGPPCGGMDREMGPPGSGSGPEPRTALTSWFSWKTCRGAIHPGSPPNHLLPSALPVCSPKGLVASVVLVRHTRRGGSPSQGHRDGESGALCVPGRQSACLLRTPEPGERQKGKWARMAS